MEVFKDKEKRKGLIGTILFHIALLVLFAIYGLTYMTPRPEQGVLINFGTSDVGSGDVQPETSGEEVPVEEEVVEEVVTPPTESEVNPTEEEVMTQDLEETIETPPKKKEKTQEEIQREKEEQEQIEKQKEFEAKMKKVWNNQKKGGSEGTDNESGDKGQENGTTDGDAYSGTPGGGGDGIGDYRLSGRNALQKIKPVYDCQESGRVVVQVRVDRNGNTTDAKLEFKGTTNSASCLVKRAGQAAMKTKWEAKPDAPDVQIGTITYQFELN